MTFKTKKRKPWLFNLLGTSQESSLQRVHRLQVATKDDPYQGGWYLLILGFTVKWQFHFSLFHFSRFWCAEKLKKYIYKQKLDLWDICLYRWESNSVVRPGWLFISGVINYYIRMCRWWSIIQWWVNEFPASLKHLPVGSASAFLKDAW